MLARASTGFHTRVGDSSWDTMARKIRDAKLESRTARLRLPVQKKPFTGPALARGIHLLYRRNKGNGTWIAKASNGHGGYWTKGFAVADDFHDLEGKRSIEAYRHQDIAVLLSRLAMSLFEASSSSTLSCSWLLTVASSSLLDCSR